MPDSRLTDEMIEAAAKALRPWIWIQRTGGVIQEIQNARSQSLADASDALTAALALLPDEAAIRADERAKIAAEIRALAGPEPSYPPQNEHARGYRTGIISAANWTANNGAAVERANAARASAAATEETR